MQKNDGDPAAIGDPLADIIRAAGRRPPPPPEHYERVYAATHAVWQQQLRRRRRRWYPLAAAFALLALGAALWQTVLTPPSPGPTVAIVTGRFELFAPDTGQWTAFAGLTVPHGARVRTGGDGSAALALTAGGSLRLDNGTEITLAEPGFELHAGRVYFDSDGRRANSAIDVFTSLGTVRDIGTQFEVLATPARLRIRTRSGEITVLDSQATQRVFAQAGEEIEVSAGGAVARRAFAPDDPQWSWAEALAAAPDFDPPSVMAYLEWIARETGRRLVFTSEAVRIQADLSRFLGDPAGLAPAELLVTIAATSDFSYVLTPDGAILIGRDDQLR